MRIWFWGKRKKPAQPRKRTSHDVAMAKVNKIVNGKLIERLKVDPELQAAFFEKNFGIKVRPLDPIKAQRDEMKGLFLNRAKDAIANNNLTNLDSVSRAILNGVVDELVNIAGREGADRPDYNDPEVLAESYKRLEKAFGGGSSFLRSLLNPEVITLALGVITKVLFKDSAGTPGKKVYVIIENGRSLEMDEAAYRKYLEDKLLMGLNSPQGQPSDKAQKPSSGSVDNTDLSNVDNTKPNPPDSGDAGKEQASNDNRPDSPNVPSPKSELPVTETNDDKSKELDVFEAMTVLPYVLSISEAIENKQPDEFADEIVNSANQGDADCISLANFIRSRSYADVLRLLKPHREHPEMGVYIKKLEASENWFNKFIAQVNARWQQS